MTSELEYDEMIDGYQKDLDEARRWARKLYQENKQLKAQFAEWKAEEIKAWSSADIEANKLEEENEQLKEKQQKYIESYLAVRDERELLKTQLSAANEEWNNLKADQIITIMECQHLRQQLAAAVARAEKAEAENKQLKERVSDLQRCYYYEKNRKEELLNGQS